MDAFQLLDLKELPELPEFNSEEDGQDDLFNN